MKQSLETLKSYFETGDKPTQGNYEDLLDSFVHKDDTISGISENTSFINSVFIDTQNGDDTTAEISSRSKPYQTIDAAIMDFEAEKPRTTALTSYEHSFLKIILISCGTYPINGLLPQRNIHFQSNEFCTVDFSNNSNEFINGAEVNTYYKYIFTLPYGTFLNDSGNKISGNNLIFKGEFDTIENYGVNYNINIYGSVVAAQVNVNYNLLKGRGSIFTTRNSAAINTFKGNIESVGGDLMLNNQGLGVNYFDFNEAYGTHKTSLMYSGLLATLYVKFGKHYPDVSSEILKISGNSRLYVNFKEGAETYGSFTADEIYLTGNPVTVNASLARVISKLIFDNISIKSNTAPISFASAGAEVIFKNSYLEVPSNLALIETNTNFSNDVLTFIGYNSIFQTSSLGTNLITKFPTASPTNVSYKVELQNSLVTNGVLNTTITGNTDTTATLTIGTTNTY